MHDTYFVLAHFHYTFYPFAFIVTYAGFTYWFPIIFGKIMNDSLGKLHLWLTICRSTDLPAALRARRFRPASPDLRLHELPRSLPALAAGSAGLASVSLCIMLGAQLIFFYNVTMSWRSGEKARRT